MCTEPNRPHDAEQPLIHRLRLAFQSHDAFQQLLSEPDVLRQIMNTVEVRQWLFEHSQGRSDGHDPCDPRARQRLTQMMEASKMIRGRGYISEEIYAEAYARTWEWFAQKLSTYDPKQASFVHWFNQKLRFIIHDVIRERAKQLQWEQPIDERFDVPARNRDRWQETVEEWIDHVEQNAAEFGRCRMQSPHSHINCHALLLNILRAMLADPVTIDQVDWDKLAQAQEISPESLKRFCQRRCFRIFKSLA